MGKIELPTHLVERPHTDDRRRDLEALGPRYEAEEEELEGIVSEHGDDGVVWNVEMSHTVVFRQPQHVIQITLTFSRFKHVAMFLFRFVRF
jgi:hypothetical protein